MATDAFAEGVDTPAVTVVPDPNDPNRGITQKAAPRTELVGDGPSSADVLGAMRALERKAQAGELSPEAMAAWGALKKQQGLTPEILAGGEGAPLETSQYHGVGRGVGVAATGFNKGVGSFVDLLNKGLSELGIPTSDEPFMGSAFVDKYLAGAQFQPQNIIESVLQRAGFEVGANVLPGAGGMAVRGAAVARGVMAARETEAVARTAQAGERAVTTLHAIKEIPHEIVTQMLKVHPVKLAALETAIAGGAGTGAEIVRQTFPEGGATAEFFGELLASFAPSVMLGMVQKARSLAEIGRAAIGLETVKETKARLAEKLGHAAKPEDVRAGVKRAEELRETVSPDAEPGTGLELSAGEAIGGGVADVQRAIERKGIDSGGVKGGQSFRAKAIERRNQNIEAVKNYFNATAPAGNPTRLIEELERQRASHEALMHLGVARTQAKLDAVRGELSSKTAQLLNDLESRMWAADQRVEQRLAAIGSKLSPKERGELIRQEYQAELSAFRERSRADYHELDMLGHAELPVEGTLGALHRLEAEFPDHLQILRKINPSLSRVLDNLGHDYELQLRAQKALDDLGIRDASGTGTRIQIETHGTGGTRDVTGLRRGTPQWYRDLTLKPYKPKRETERTLEEATTPLSRATINARLEKFAKGFRLNPNDDIDKEVANALFGDGEFRLSPYNEPVLQHLTSDTPSASLKDLRQIRSDLLVLARNAKASDNRVQSYVLHELLTGVEQDIDQLLPGQTAFADVYPEHGTLYRNVSADYRAGVETLMKGTANKLRRMNSNGDYTLYDESVAKLFFTNETTLQDFQKAFGNRDLAKAALRDYALEDFIRAAVKKKDGVFTLDQSGYELWMKEHEAHLKAFPDLEPVFKNTAKLLEEAEDLRIQARVFQDGKRGEEALLRRLHASRRPGDVTVGDVTEAEARYKHALELEGRSQQEWERSIAGRFLGGNVDNAAIRIVTADDPLKEYNTLLTKVQHNPEAVAGLKKAIWHALTEKIQPRLTGMTGTMNLGVLHKELQRWIHGHEQVMTKVLGEEGMNRIKTTAEVLQKIARGGKEGSDTAINLQVQVALASTWFTRATQVVSGRIGKFWAGGERVAQYLTKYFQGMTQRQQDAILLESFFDPKVYETLVLAGTHGPANDIVRHRTKMHLHMLNLSEQTSEKAE